MNRSLAALGAAAAAIALALTACSSDDASTQESASDSSESTQEESSGESAASEPQTLTLFTTGDVNIQELWEDVLIPQFQEDNPDITIEVTAADSSTDTTSLSRLAASVDSDEDASMDIIDSGFLPSAESAGLLLQVDDSSLPNLASVDPASIPSAGLIPYRGSSVVVAYNSDVIDTPPASMEELLTWVADNPGRFTYNSPSTGGSGLGFVQAVLDSEMTAEQSTVFIEGYDQEAESDWDPGFEKLAALTPNVYQNTYPNGNQEVLNLLSSGAIDMTLTWSDMFLSSKDDGSLAENIKAASLAAPGLPGGASLLGIPVNSAHQEAALEFVDWVLAPEQQVTISTAVAGYPAIAVDELPADAQEKFEGLTTDGLQPFYSSESIADLNAKWQELVP